MYPLTDSDFLRLAVALVLAAPEPAARATCFLVTDFLVVVERVEVFLPVALLVIGTIATNANTRRRFNRWRIIINSIQSSSECKPGTPV